MKKFCGIDVYKRQGQYDPQTRQSFTPALCHRLDRNTEGIVIGAKTAEALRRMNAYIREHKVEKHYVCIVEGVMEQKDVYKRQVMYTVTDKYNFIWI